MTEQLMFRSAERYRNEQQAGELAPLHRDIQLAPRQVRTMTCFNGYVYLSDLEDSAVTVESELGVFDRLTPNVAECSHVHCGQVTFSNFSDVSQVIEVVVMQFAALPSPAALPLRDFNR